MTRLSVRFGRGPPEVSRTRSGLEGFPSASFACAGCYRPARTSCVRPSEDRGYETEREHGFKFNKLIRRIVPAVKLLLRPGKNDLYGLCSWINL